VRRDVVGVMTMAGIVVLLLDPLMLLLVVLAVVRQGHAGGTEREC
jgi:hypothetical protein